MNHVYGVTLATLQTIWPQLRQQHGRQAKLTWTIEYPEVFDNTNRTWQPDDQFHHAHITGPATERGRSHIPG